jgi:hypothetical protein
VLLWALNDTLNRQTLSYGATAACTRRSLRWRTTSRTSQRCLRGWIRCKKSLTSRIRSTTREWGQASPTARKLIDQTPRDRLAGRCIGHGNHAGIRDLEDPPLSTSRQMHANSVSTVIAVLAHNLARWTSRSPSPIGGADRSHPPSAAPSERRTVVRIARRWTLRALAQLALADGLPHRPGHAARTPRADQTAHGRATRTRCRPRRPLPKTHRQQRRPEPAPPTTDLTDTRRATLDVTRPKSFPVSLNRRRQTRALTMALTDARFWWSQPI